MADNRILVLDDEKRIRDLYCQTFANAGLYRPGHGKRRRSP